MAIIHRPVMVNEVIASLNCKPGGIYVDGTVGGGGHAYEILRATAPEGVVIGIDIDEMALKEARERLSEFGERMVLVKGNYVEIDEILRQRGISAVDGILLDLGISSFQLDEPSRGFSFRYDAPLDMRMDKSQELTAYDLVNSLTEDELAHLIYAYGEEKRAKKIARAIVKERKLHLISTTGQLTSLISEVIAPFKKGRIHPATKTFQALRIAVNQELTNLPLAIRKALDVLKAGGRFSIISFHSLEDRIVKQEFRKWERGCQCLPGTFPCRCGYERKIKVLTKKPVTPKSEELLSNARARSAKLRTAERI